MTALIRIALKGLYMSARILTVLGWCIEVNGRLCPLPGMLKPTQREMHSIQTTSMKVTGVGYTPLVAIAFGTAHNGDRFATRG